MMERVVNIKDNSKVRTGVGGKRDGIQVRRRSLTERDERALEFVLDQKFASLDQLYRAVWKGKDSRSNRYAWERVKLLEGEGYLCKLPVFLRKKTYYGASKTGFRYLETKLPNRSFIKPPRNIEYREFEHDDLVTDCRLHMMESGIATTWISERQLLSEILDRAHRGEQMKYIARGALPDGVFRFQKDGKLRAFELELTPKTKARYLSKFTEYVSKIEQAQVEFSGVLFVACTRRIENALRETTSKFPTQYFRVMSKEQLLGKEKNEQ